MGLASVALLIACALERDGALGLEKDAGGGFGGAGGSGLVGGTGGISGAGTGGAGAAGSAGVGGASGSSGVAGADAGEASAGAAGAAGAGGAPTWKPSDINDCVLWLDAADPATVIPSTGALASWTDKCGGGTATSTGNGAPVVGQAGLKPAIRCDGVNDQIALGGPTLDAAEYSLFFVFGKNFSSADQHPLWSNRNQPAVPSGTVTYLGFYNRTYLYQNTASPKLLQGTNFYATSLITTIYEFVATTSGKREVLLAGQMEASTPTGSSTATALRVGTLCADLPNNHFAAYDLHEVVAYSRALTDTEREVVRTELGAKWGL